MQQKKTIRAISGLLSLHHWQEDRYNNFQILLTIRIIIHFILSHIIISFLLIIFWTKGERDGQTWYITNLSQFGVDKFHI